MGLFGKRKARKEAEAKAEAAQSKKWDNPTQTKKPAYKQKGFDAGEGTNRNGSGPDKKGNDKYTPPARKTTSEKPKVETKPKVEVKSRFDLEDERYERELANKKKKAATTTTTKPTTTTTTTEPGSNKTNVKNKEKTKSSGYATNYSKSELASDNSDKRKTSYKNKKAAEESGATTYEHWNPKTRKYTKTATSHHTKSKNYKNPSK